MVKQAANIEKVLKEKKLLCKAEQLFVYSQSECKGPYFLDFEQSDFFSPSQLFEQSLDFFVASDFFSVFAAFFLSSSLSSVATGVSMVPAMAVALVPPIKSASAKMANTFFILFGFIKNSDAR